MKTPSRHVETRRTTESSTLTVAAPTDSGGSVRHRSANGGMPYSESRIMRICPLQVIASCRFLPRLAQMQHQNSSK